jgi:hypothetical protein
MTFSAPRLGLALGGLLAALHALWALLVALAWAQPLLDFIFWLHFVTPPYRVEPFEPGRAAVLIAVTGAAGFAGGAGFALIWNRVRPGRS